MLLSSIRVPLRSLIRVAFATFAVGSSQAALTDLTGVVQMDAGGAWACAVTDAGAVRCWTVTRNHAVEVPGLSSGAMAVAVSRGGIEFIDAQHACALMSAGTVKCWGNNDQGQLGNGTTTSSETPVDVAGLAGAVAVAAGTSQTCAVLSNGTVQCWGGGSSTPTAVAGLSDIVAISMSPSHSCALTSAGGAKCWGDNSKGQLGNGTTTSSSAPVDVSSLTSGVASISAGGALGHPFAGGTNAFTCAITTAGGAKCWGTGGFLGDGTSDSHLTPFDVSGLTSGVSQLSTGGITVDGPSTSFLNYGHACAVTTAGQAKCWGFSRCGAFGHTHVDCNPWGHSHLAPADVLGLPGLATAAAAGGTFSCFLLADGRVACTGTGFSEGQPIVVKTGTAPQTITITQQPSSIAIGGMATVGATATSGLPVAFSSLTAGICSVGGTTVTNMGVSEATVSGLSGGMCVIAANQPGDAAYDPAPQVTFDFRVGDPVAQTITFGAAPSVVVDGVGILDATASSGLPVSFASNTPSICSVSGNMVTGLALGSCTVAARQNGDELYAPAPEVTQTFSVTANTGTFILAVSKTGTGSGTVTSAPTRIDCGSVCAGNFDTGASVTLTATGDAGSKFGGWSGACTGTGACNVTMNAAKSVVAHFVIDSPIARLANISTRGLVLTSTDVMIAGFVIGGNTPKTVVVNLAGPSLSQFGISNPLFNPALILVRSADGAILASNDNWQDASNAAQIQAAGLAPNHALESAIMMTLPPGAYTALAHGAGGTTGIGLVGVFEVDHPEVPLLNVSTRGNVLTGDNVLIAGFIIQGDSPQTVVVNVAGPSLSNAGVANPLGNPTLTLVRHSPRAAVIGTNDDWQAAANASDILASGFAPNHALEPAIMMTLPPGAYTAIVQGVGGSTGIGVVGAFRVQ